MTREEAYNRIDAIIAKHEIDDEYVTITSMLDYDALRIARKALEQEHSRSAEITQYRHDCEKLMEENERLKKALEQEPREITLEDVKGYCKPRCLTIITNELLYELTHPKIKALEQEQKTVLYSGDGYADGYMVYDMAECPNCGYEYEDGDKDWGLPFCPNCGQSLNWESEEV